MGMFSRLKIGDRLNIERYEGNINMDKKGMLSTQIIDLNKKHIYISVPTYKGKRHPIYKGQKISITFYRDAGEYQFYAKVIKKTDDNILAFLIKPISELTKTQRRNYYRLPISIDIIIERKQEDEIYRLKCVTKDLSGGGVRAICNEGLKEGENIKIELFLDDDTEITVKGDVVRVIEDTANNCYELGIKFDEISEEEQDKIYAFIFEKQRLLRKKGLM